MVGVAVAVVFADPSPAADRLPPVRRAVVTMWRALSSPGRVALLVVGNVAAQCLYAGSLLACLHAFGSSVNFWTLLALNIGISTIASLVPIPGGGTAVTSIGLAGTLTALGVRRPERRRRRPRPPGRGQLPPGDPGLVRDERPHPQGAAVITRGRQR